MITLMSVLVACGIRFGEEPAPERTFRPEDLLISEDVLPPMWTAFDPVFPAGDDLVTRESVCQGFGTVVEGERIVGGVSHCVYRQQNKNIARRSFEYTYLRFVRSLSPLDEWTYQSPVAQQSHFACGNASDGSGFLFCEWGAQYEEYIVLFNAKIVSGEFSIADMEKVIRAIDARMAEHLELPAGRAED